MLIVLLTLLYFTRSLFQYKSYKLRLEASNDPHTYILTDGELLQSSASAYMISLAMWLPLVSIHIELYIYNNHIS